MLASFLGRQMILVSRVREREREREREFSFQLARETYSSLHSQKRQNVRSSRGRQSSLCSRETERARSARGRQREVFPPPTPTHPPSLLLAALAGDRACSLCSRKTENARSARGRQRMLAALAGDGACSLRSPLCRSPHGHPQPQCPPSLLPGFVRGSGRLGSR